MSDKPYGRQDLPQQQSAPPPSELPDEFQYHPSPYELKHEDLEKLTHDYKEDLRPLAHRGAGTETKEEGTKDTEGAATAQGKEGEDKDKDSSSAQPGVGADPSHRIAD